MSKPDYQKIRDELRQARNHIDAAEAETDGEVGINTALDRIADDLDSQEDAAYAMWVATSAPYSDVADRLKGAHTTLQGVLDMIGDTGKAEVFGPVEEHHAARTAILDALGAVEEAQATTRRLAENHGEAAAPEADD